MRLAAELMRRGENPESEFEAAFRDLDEAVKSDPAARILRAEAFVHRGEWKAAAGQNGDPDYLAAFADTKLALEADLFAADAWIWQGRARTLAAAARPVSMRHYQEAIDDLYRVLAVAPNHVEALRFRADAYQRRAALKAGRLLDASADYRAALIDYEHAIRLQPSLEGELRNAVAACRAGVDSKR
jgi:tetratricopeptide (TPR) repeat protein